MHARRFRRPTARGSLSRVVWETRESHVRHSRRRPRLGRRIWGNLSVPWLYQRPIIALRILPCRARHPHSRSWRRLHKSSQRGPTPVVGLRAQKVNFFANFEGTSSTDLATRYSEEFGGAPWPALRAALGGSFLKNVRFFLRRLDYLGKLEFFCEKQSVLALNLCSRSCFKGFDGP